MVSLAEELVLLALDDDKGSVSIGANTLDTALAGAQLIDLVRAGRVTIDNKDLVVLDPTPTGDPALDSSLATVQASRSKRASSVIPKLTKGLRNRLTEQLVQQGVLQVEESKVLGLFPRTRHPQLDGSTEQELMARLRGVVLNGDTPDERTASLAAVVQAADLEGLFLERTERREAKGRMKELASGEALSPAISSAIQSVNAAATAAIVAATAASAASCSAATSASC